MAAEYDGVCRTLTLAQALYGDTGSWPEAAGYQAKQREKLAKLRRGLPDNSPEGQEIDRLLQGGETHGNHDTEHL